MRLICFMALLFCYSCGIAGQANTADMRAIPDTVVTAFSGLPVDSILAYARTFVGCRYGYGSCGPKTFDCSGYVRQVYGHFGIELPHGSGAQATLCDEVKLKKVKPGDLLFFSGRKISGKKIGHVAIVYEVLEDKIMMIHASVQSGVVVEELGKSAYFSRRFIKAGKIKEG